MQIGPLDTRARLEYKVVTQDETYGTEVITWTLLRVMWVGIQDELPSKSEAVKQGLAVATRRARVRANYAVDIDSSMRLVVMRPTSTVYQIVAGPAVIGDKEGIEMWVEAVSS
jgi:head-tail adaptor